VLLYFGVRKNAIFFDTFIGAFFWLGFWLKLTFRVAFMGGEFHEPVGNFTGSGPEFDQALLITSIGLFGLVAISFIREKFFFNYPKEISDSTHTGLFIFYRNNRKLILVGFTVIFIVVGISNFYYGIYQRGSIPRTILPYGLGGIYKWLLLFGLASFSALIIKYEFTLNKKTSYLPMGIAVAETFISNVSLLSRGMILNAGALIYGVIHAIRFYRLKSSRRFFIATISAVIVVFLSSVLLVNQLRILERNPTSIFYTGKFDTAFKEFDIVKASRGMKVLFLDRWVGIEGVLAVSTYPKQGWDLWNIAWKEKFSVNRTSFYDENIITSPYRNTDKSKHHYITLPGILAFSFYPNSYSFLFLSMVVIGAVAAVIEFSVYRLGNKNIILCALLSQVVAYRYAHFGYVPGQSYLLFGSLFLNLLIIYFLDQILSYWYRYRGICSKESSS